MLLGKVTFRRLCRARDLLVDVDAPRRSVREIARSLRLSQFHFIRQFAAVFGETPHQFRTRVRIDRARALLATEPVSVTEVCLELGFESLGSFSALFARHVGESPSAFRRRLRPLFVVPGAIPQRLGPGCFTLMGMLPADAFRNFGEASSVRAP